MRHLLLVFFFAVSCLQLAVAGTRGIEPGVEASPPAHAVAAASGQGLLAGPCGAHGAQADVDAGQNQPCDLTQACEACTLCQACHQPAMSGAPITATFQTEDHPPAAFAVHYASAERAPGFKPPIL